MHSLIQSKSKQFTCTFKNKCFLRLIFKTHTYRRNKSLLKILCTVKTDKIILKAHTKKKELKFFNAILNLKYGLTLCAMVYEKFCARGLER